MRKIIYCLVVVVLLAGLVLGCAKEAAPAPAPAPAPTPTPVPVMNLKVAEYSAESGSLKESNEWWASEIDKLTDGRVKLTFYWGGSLFGAKNILGAIEKGAADMGMITTLYYAEVIPLTYVGSVLSTVASGANTKAAVRANWEYNHLPEVLAEQHAHNFEYVKMFANKTFHLFTTKPVKTVADLKGMRIRATGPFHPLFTAVGAVPTTMAFSDVYEALQKGILDGVPVNVDGFYRYKQYEVAKYLTYVGLGSTMAMGTAINLDVFNKFPPDLQKAIRDLGAVANDKIADTLDTLEVQQLEEIKQAGLTIVASFSEEEKQPFYDAAEVSWYEYAKELDGKGLPGTWAVDTHLELLKKHYQEVK